MFRPLPVIVSFAVLVTSGLVHGIWTERWQKSAALQNACALVEKVPLVIGPWKGQELAVNPDEFSQAGAEDYWMRRYTHKNQAATVLLMCGRAGRMSVHTPEICYQGLGYQVVETPVRQRVDFGGSRKGEFWTARFTKDMGPTGDLRLFWAWSPDGAWHAPSSPRWQFRGRPFLYKLYVVQDVGQDQPSEPGIEFLQQLLPELDKVLFAEGGR